MTKRIYTAEDVDLEQLGVDIVTLGHEIAERDIAVFEVSAEHSVFTEDVETVEISVKFAAQEDSMFSRGYTIPMVEDNEGGENSE